jgi:endo-1,4-beta-D-glucanase Y
MRRSTLLVCIRAGACALPAIVIACGSSTTPGGFDNSNGGSSSNTTATTGTSISYGTSTSISTTTLADGGVSTTVVTVTTSSIVTTTGGVSTSGSGSSASSSQSKADGGAGDGGTTRTCAVAGTNVIADFEDGKPTDVAANNFTGTWGTFASQSTPNAPTVGASDDTLGPSCNTKALHAVLSTPVTTPTTNYGQTKNDLQTHTATAAIPNMALTGDGVSFDIKTGSGATTFPITFEIADQASQPATNNGNPWGGTATTAGVDQFNNRGWLLSNSAANLGYSGAVIGSTWTRVYVPFAEMPPHFLPSGCPAGGPCQAPNLDPAHTMTLQFALNPDQNASGTFDIWVDNVQTYTGTQGLTPPDMPNNLVPTFADAALSGCTKPTGSNVGGKYLQWAYRNWYKRFVVSAGGNQLRVQRPENNNNTVSEGIGYGMLIAVAMGDKTAFDGFFAYWQAHPAAGKTMIWITDGSSQGSATDADQDAAFALLQAEKKWSGNGYGTYASALLGDIWSNEIDPTSHLPTGGSNYKTNGTPSTSGQLTNPSYFAPGYYPTFAKADSGHSWAQVATAVYGSLNSLLGSNKLPSAWCQTNCTVEVANNNTGAQNGTLQYQYDAHRVPWRIGLDKCWGTATSSMATSVLSKVVGVFSTIASTNQIGRLVDLYNPDGSAVSTGVPNSMSLIGTAAVGGMSSSSYSAFVNSAWQFLLDGGNRAALDVGATPSQSGYSYFNSSVGLLALLSLSGNITPP